MENYCVILLPRNRKGIVISKLGWIGEGLVKKCYMLTNKIFFSRNSLHLFMIRMSELIFNE